jgi:hypothetical protein
MNPSADGIQGVDLIVKNPQEGALYGHTLYIAGTTYGASDEGIVKLDLDNPLTTQEKIVSEKTMGSSITGVSILNADYGIVFSFDANWNKIGCLFSLRDYTIGAPLSVPDAGGGVVYADGWLYVGSRDYEKPGLYVYNPFGKESAAMTRYFPTELPPYSIAYVGDITPTGTSDEAEAPESFAIIGAYPNPFNPAATVSFILDRACAVTVDVFNIAGQKVDRLTDSFMSAGKHDIVWNAEAMPSGVYFIRVHNGFTAKTAAVTLVK